MAWIRPTLQQIIDRIDRDMESRLTGNVALLRRALLRVLSRVFAGAIHISYGYVEQMSKQIMPDTSDTEYLDRHALIWGLIRKPAAFASGYAAFTGTESEVIPEGTEIRSLEGQEYATLAQGTILNSVAKIPIQAKEAGAAGNFSVPATLSIIAPIPSVDSDCYCGLLTLVYSSLAGGTFSLGNRILNTTSAGEAVVIEDNGTDTMLAALISGEFANGNNFNNSNGVSATVNGTPAVNDALTGGQESESDDDLRARILQRIQQPPAGGTASDYVRWATEVVSQNGVVDSAWALAENPGPGYVTVVIKAAGIDPVPSSALIADVLAYINDRRPITANVIVVGITKVLVDFDIDILPFAPGLETAIRTNMEQLFGSEMEPGGTIYISQIRNAISSAGAADYVINSIVTVPALSPPADPNSNLVLTGYQYGIVNTMTFGAL